MHRFRVSRFLCCFSLVAASSFGASLSADDPAKLFDRESKMQGFTRQHFSVAERRAYIVLPKEAAAGKPWIWRARFPGYHAEMDLELVRRGFHLGYVDVGGMFGSPKAMRIGDLFYKFVTERVGLAKKPVLEGVSRGGLFVYNWAVKHPDKVSCIYCDTPVLDFKSWPAGFGQGIGSAATWKQCLAEYELTEDAARTFQGIPIESVAAIAKAKIPILHIVSENDRVVPPAENTYLFKTRLEAAGHGMEVISVAKGTDQSNGHHFTHPDPKRVVAFIEKHATAIPKIVVPATTSYSEPDPRSLRLEKGNIVGWSDAKQQVVWYGWLAAGELEVAVQMAPENSDAARFAMTVASIPNDKPDKQHLRLEASASKAGQVAFGQVVIEKAGYHRFELVGLQKSGGNFGEVQSLELTGSAVRGSQFNLTLRRNAASVHLWYPVPKPLQVQAFYNEVTVETVPLWSYYMACGFHRGYFGIQVNSPTERRIIFSVWDSGREPVDRKKVRPEDQVQLLKHGKNVVAHGFGNEGTGGHSHLVYAWKPHTTYKFLVTAEPDDNHTIFTGYFFFPENNAWGLIARFRAPKDGGYLRGLYSFNENFGGANGQVLRKATFGNQWIRQPDGTWNELTNAKFTHDGHGGKHRRDIATGTSDGRFFLINGGFLPDRSTYGQKLTRPHSATPPVVKIE
ncbi:MAG: DUF3472 domain-containing protein [Planctomycetota bacterium]|nr:DUF3472 domain-containing protein [Planctomycetota bacterium]